jgi:hypothetical protein
MLPETVIIDVGDLLTRLRSIVAYKQGLARVEIDTPYSPMNVNIDEYIEMIVDSLVSHNGALESLHALITIALNEENIALDERIGDILEAMGILIHNQLAQLRLYEKNDGPLAYFYSNRDEDWIMLSRISQPMIDNITRKIDDTLPLAIHSAFKW